MKKYCVTFLLIFLIFAISCNNTTNSLLEEDIQSVSINNYEIYEYRTGISGDEEGASIILQAKHFDISNIVRNAETQWEAVYKYKPKSGYKGSDYVEIQLSTGSDGASPPSKIEIIKINFQIK